ncbi:MAG: hypothetical protein A2527_14250 [Candidatus Lambdaproteobacteria bacterium RIFOXYD2_FULL_50_16]|uniref:Uncharacterized protein n=1 Tax=Candidatus Lambdaproteobacteria bacterium RIFOXYD2_FULL_50_16 TaxID=1817772 RepID=A0A1F6G4P7_9PROT|nr:MAG: hypothetical protein A2527_14250 [Candidatus Lambdaproteobacteria bacterium RIFOXYD2_FULL_50_16]
MPYTTFSHETAPTPPGNLLFVAQLTGLDKTQNIRFEAENREAALAHAQKRANEIFGRFGGVWRLVEDPAGMPPARLAQFLIEQKTAEILQGDWWVNRLTSWRCADDTQAGELAQLIKAELARTGKTSFLGVDQCCVGVSVYSICRSRLPPGASAYQEVTTYQLPDGQLISRTGEP